jgi:hypothetical protein
MAGSAHGQRFDRAEVRPRLWRRCQRDAGYTLWASFLMACAASAVFFAMVDPEILSGTTTPGWEISRQAGYAIGFFGFWLLTAATAIFVIWLVRTEPSGIDAGAHGTPEIERKRIRRSGLLRRRVRPRSAAGREELP